LIPESGLLQAKNYFHFENRAIIGMNKDI